MINIGIRVARTAAAKGSDDRVTLMISASIRSCSVSPLITRRPSIRAVVNEAAAGKHVFCRLEATREASLVNEGASR